MKKFFTVLVTLFVCMVSMAQLPMNIIIDGFKDGGDVAILANGQEAYIGDIKCHNVFESGYTIAQNINRHLTKLYKSDKDAYSREAGRYAGIPGVVIYGNAMMNGMGTVGMGYGYGMYGTGMNNSGMVYGAGGMAGAQSQVVIDNQNMMSTVGSGLQMSYDTGSNSLSVSGDPLMAAGRLINFIGGSGKKAKTRAAQSQQTTNGGYTNGQVVRDANGNLYTINNGVLVPVQQMQQTRAAQSQQVTRQQQTRQSQQQPVQSQQVTNNYGGGVATTPVYNVAGDF